ncbi:MAG: hypothetical protein OXQ89_06835, partial [Rhodospirillaceae bacterium]|nr:hypothetical protein [Rhodospirillaceae bacterium]
MIVRICMALAVLALAGSCSTLGVDPFPEPIREPKPAVPVDGGALGDGEGEEAEVEGLRITGTPGVTIQKTVAEGIADRLGENLRGDPIQVSFHDVPVVAFVNEVFGELLGLSFSISPGLSQKEDLVTLRLTEPLPPSQLFATARRVLEDYGISLGEQEGVITFAPTQEISSADIPLLISGRTLPEVPPTHRTIFQLVPIKIVRHPLVSRWLRDAFPADELAIIPDADRNALLLKGNLEIIGRALDMIEVLDQPMFRGQHGLIFEPQFLEAEAMSEDLEAVLRAEGYQAGTRGLGGIVLVPLTSVNKLVVFAPDRQVLNHIEKWARELDAQQQQTIQDAVFTYQVLHTQAEEMTDTLNGILGIATARPTDLAPALDEGPSSDGDSRRRGGRIVVDKNRNMLLFRGSGKEWGELLDVIRELDKPVPSVLIELLVAEVTLSDEEQSGIEFMFRSTLGVGRSLTGGTLNSL